MNLDKIQKKMKNKIVSIRVTDDELKFIKKNKINPAKLFSEALKEVFKESK